MLCIIWLTVHVHGLQVVRGEYWLDCVKDRHRLIYPRTGSLHTGHILSTYISRPKVCKGSMHHLIRQYLVFLKSGNFENEIHVLQVIFEVGEGHTSRHVRTPLYRPCSGIA